MNPTRKGVKMKPVKAWAIVQKTNGNMLTVLNDVLWFAREDVLRSHKRLALPKAWRIAPVLITEVKSRKK